jgi:KTSC domain
MAEQIPQMMPVSSANLSAIGYDRAEEKLFIQWKDGRTSVYEQVPSQVATDFATAQSYGKKFNEIIKGRYPHRYVNQ